MLKVKLFSDFGHHDFLLNHLKNQTPDLINNSYKDMEFVENDYTNAVIFNHPTQEITTPASKNIGFLMDIPQIFNPIRTNVGPVCKYFCWYKEHANNIGDIFRQCPSYMFYHSPITHNKNKSKRMSMIVSGKGFMPDQRKRLEILDKLLSDNINIDFYGRNLSTSARDPRIKGSIPFMTKNQALAYYEYSICFENLCYDGWLTEKFYDCIINNTIPLTNSPTVLKYFPEKSYCYIDFGHSVDRIVEIIKEIYYKDDFNSRLSDLEIAKNEVIYGNFSLCEKIYKELKNLSP